jgi:uncharacterized protein (DUF2062 family)
LPAGHPPFISWYRPGDLSSPGRCCPGMVGDWKETFRMLAYLDAASGSMVVQAVLAGAAGAAVVLKLGWRRLTSPFRRRSTAQVAEREER